VTNAEIREIYEWICTIKDNEFAKGRVMEIIGRNTTLPEAGDSEIDLAVLPVSTVRKLQRCMKELNPTENSHSLVDTPTNRERKSKCRAQKQRRNSDTQLSSASKTNDAKNHHLDSAKSLKNSPEYPDIRKRACVVCMDAPTEAVIIPCGHLAMCLQDAKKLKECPICRISYTPTQVVKVYQSGIDIDS